MRRSKVIQWTLVMALAAAPAAAGDGEYVVRGRSYKILKTAAGYVERGIASWYGGSFHGKPTASGERFNMHELTAAHKTLPIPIDVEVTNLRTGKSIVVRVNDRGPFIGERLIDLSFAAGKALGLVGPGTDMVEVRALPALVQVGAYARSVNAERMRARLEEAGFGRVVVHDLSDGRRQLKAVRIEIAGRAAYDGVADRLRGIGVKDAWLVPSAHRD